MSLKNGRLFRIELGINLLAVPIIETRWKHRYFPLDNAFVDITDAQNPKPEWFTRLRVGDQLSIRLVDISDLLEPRSPLPHPALIHLHFTEPTTGKASSPFTDSEISWRISDHQIDRVSPVFSRSADQRLPTLDIVGETPDGQPADLVLARVRSPFQSFELSVALRVERDPWTDFFVFDPEMIVSDIDIPDDDHEPETPGST